MDSRPGVDGSLADTPFKTTPEEHLRMLAEQVTTATQPLIPPRLRQDTHDVLLSTDVLDHSEYRIVVVTRLDAKY